MIDKPEPGQEKTAKLLIMDNGPISTLSNIDGALDWFFVPGCEVLITDMVLVEARKTPRPGASPRKAARASFEDWLSRNKHRITVVKTDVGADYENSLALWKAAGSPDSRAPRANDLGEASILNKLRVIRKLQGEGDSVIVVMDDRDGRSVVQALRMNVDLMGTRVFVELIAKDFHIKEAETCWFTLKAILGKELDDGDEDDPVYVRVGR
jgi:hypothetical protein